MKIETDIERLSTTIIQPQALNQNLKAISQAGSIPATSSSSQTLQNLLKKRAFIDAVIITQIAQSFFQNAILISSRLKNIASEALVSGKMNQTELTNALTGIRSSLNELQEVPVPKAFKLQNYTTIYQYTGVRIDIPEVNEEINSLNAFVNELSSGTMLDLKKIDRINENLINKESAVNDSYNQLINEFPLLGIYNFNVSNYPELFTNAIKQIINYPQTALKSQGNINYKFVKSLM